MGAGFSVTVVAVFSTGNKRTASDFIWECICLPHTETVFHILSSSSFQDSRTAAFLSGLQRKQERLFLWVKCRLTRHELLLLTRYTKLRNYKVTSGTVFGRIWKCSYKNDWKQDYNWVKPLEDPIFSSFTERGEYNVTRSLQNESQEKALKHFIQFLKAKRGNMTPRKLLQKAIRRHKLLEESLCVFVV